MIFKAENNAVVTNCAADIALDSIAAMAKEYTSEQNILGKVLQNTEKRDRRLRFDGSGH